MKRETKFRAWDKFTQKYWNIENWHFEDEYLDLIEFGVSIADPNIKRIWRKLNEVKLMQYTGLKDKNGKNIYEGDIVRVQETMDGGRIVCLEAIASVVWNDERGCWGCEGGFEGHLADYAFGTMLNVMGNVCEVVGNIYENPDLLEEKK